MDRAVTPSRGEEEEKNSSSTCKQNKNEGEREMKKWRTRQVCAARGAAGGIPFAVRGGALAAGTLQKYSATL